MEILAALLGSLLGVVASFVTAILSRRAKEAAKVQRDKLADEVTADIKAKIHQPVFTTYAPGTTYGSGFDWQKVIARSLATAASTEPGLSKMETQKVVEEAIAPIEDRIRHIEGRSPGADTVEKATSINEAVFAVSLENLQTALEKVESRLLTKWDVAKIVFQILTALGVIVAIIFGVITYIRSP